MNKSIAALLLFLVAVPAFAHAGHMHTYMGTVAKVDRAAFVIKTTDGKDLTIQISPKTTWAHADGHPAKAGDLVAGDRVVVKMTIDGKTASAVKLAGPKTR